MAKVWFVGLRDPFPCDFRKIDLAFFFAREFRCRENLYASPAIVHGDGRLRARGQRVEEAVTQLANIADVRATVKAKRKGVIVDLDLHVVPDANLTSVIDGANAATRDILSEKVHVALIGPPRTRIHYRELRLRGRPPRRPTIGADLDGPATEVEEESDVAAEPEAAAKA